MTRRRIGVFAAAAVVSGCGMIGAPPTPAAPGTLPLPGYGTLRQTDVSVSLASGDLEIMVTPLSESVLVTTAPDTYRRLHGLATAYTPPTDGVGPDRDEPPPLFLVSFFSSTPSTGFVPEELQLRSRGVRLRPRTISPVTPGWGQRRLRQREPEMAVYLFDGPVDLETELVVTYGLVESAGWNSIIPKIQAERARARARAGR